MVVCLQNVVLTVVYVWFERFHFIKLDTTCGEIMANLKRQKVELLKYKHGKLLQCQPDEIEWEDKFYFENSSGRNGNDGRPIKFNVKVCVKVFTADSSKKMFIISLTVLQHRLFDPNNINYTFTSHITTLPVWARTKFRLLMRCFGIGYVWKSLWDKYVQHATLHINKSVYLTRFRRQITKVYISEYRTYAWMSLVSFQPGVHNLLTNTSFIITFFRNNHKEWYNFLMFSVTFTHIF